MSIREVYNAIKGIIDDDRKCIEYKKKNVTIGKNTAIGQDCTIGEYTYIGYYTRVGCSCIGRYTSIGDFCIIGPGEHRIKKVSTSYLLYKDKLGVEYYDGDNSCRAGGVTIGNDVWVGCNSVIRRGVTIGDGAVIGANSFVNADVPDYAVVAGSPARIIKYRFDKDEIEKLKASKWWEKDIVTAKKVICKMEKEKLENNERYNF